MYIWVMWSCLWLKLLLINLYNLHLSHDQNNMNVVLVWTLGEILRWVSFAPTLCNFSCLWHLSWIQWIATRILWYCLSAKPMMIIGGEITPTSVHQYHNCLWWSNRQHLFHNCCGEIIHLLLAHNCWWWNKPQHLSHNWAESSSIPCFPPEQQYVDPAEYFA